MAFPGKEAFVEQVRSARPAAAGRKVVIPVWVSLLDDQLTPVLAYRRLVAPDQREAPSFLLESVEGGERQGRHSILGAQPIVEIVAHGLNVRTVDKKVRGIAGVETVAVEKDPLEVPRRMTAGLYLSMPAPVRGATRPKCFLGGGVGFAGYDTVRYAEPEKLRAENGPRDDRGLPDLHLAFYDGVVVFDHVDKLVHVVHLVEVGADASDGEIAAAHERGAEWIERRVESLKTHSEPMASGRMARPGSGSAEPLKSNLTREQHAGMVERALEYIRAGDIFQVVIGQRFERRSKADPFDVYRALRAVNPSPYMVYMQARGCVLVASSPEILCRVRSTDLGTPALRAGRLLDTKQGPGSENRATQIVTNRPLAGTRRRGATPEEDRALERELLADPKEIAEHVMLVDLGRNDVGKVAEPGTIQIPARMVVERYSHVMHISSTVTGELREGLDCWDALRAALPVGTISGAPKIRAMQIIDELEPVRRGPYGGGMGYVGLDGDMDIALALRTMVVPTALRGQDGTWMYHIQAAGGIVADSKADEEYQETVNKAAALARAIEVAEAAFGK